MRSGKKNEKRADCTKEIETTVEFPNKEIVMTTRKATVISQELPIPGQRVSFAVNEIYEKEKRKDHFLETVKKSPREAADTCRISDSAEDVRIESAL